MNRMRRSIDDFIASNPLPSFFRGDYEVIDETSSLSSPSSNVPRINRRLARLAVFIIMCFILLASLLTLITNWFRGGGSTSATGRMHGHGGKPFPSRYQTKGCEPLKPAPPGHRHIQIHNKCQVRW